MVELSDYLKSNCRSWEVDSDNESDTRLLAHYISIRFPKLSEKTIWKAAKEWTGYIE